MDDATHPGDGSPTTETSTRKPRLGRGLQDMLGQKAGDADASGEGDTFEETGTDHVGNVRSMHTSTASPDAPAAPDKPTKPVMNPTTSANVVEDAVSLFTSYDERFTALTSQLEAACNLLKDQRQLEVRRARRSGYVGWSLVAVLIILGMVGLWRAGETIGGQRTQIRQITSQASALSGQVNAAELRISDLQSQLTDAASDHARMQSELADMRSALSKANLVIDQWMQRAHEDAARKQADGR